VRIDAPEREIGIGNGRGLFPRGHNRPDPDRPPRCPVPR
jgi:hypothetical protein